MLRQKMRWACNFKTDGANYDIIIVGGGTAGCLIASRLAELKNLKILLVEAGGDPPLESAFPSYFSYLKNTSVDWNMTSTQDKIWQYHKGGRSTITQGKMLGGSGSLNFMVHQLGNPIGYSKWAQISNDTTWTYEKLLPLLIKNEKVIDKRILNSPLDRALHGTKGKLELRKYYHGIIKKYFSAYKEIGIKNVLDINARNPIGVTEILFANGKGGRQSTAYSYLRYKKNYRNLDILTNALVTKVLIKPKDKTAYGVQIRVGNNIITVHANKEVVVCAGAIKTPQLLMLSGIGPQKHLLSKNINVLANLPVGNNFQDLPFVVLPFRMGKRNPSSKSQNPYNFGTPALTAYTAINASQNYPDYIIISTISDKLENFLQFCAVLFSFENKICDKLSIELRDKQIYTVFHALPYPESRGKIRLISKNIADQPMIDFGYYSKPKDLENHARAVMHFNKILNTTYFQRVKAQLLDPELETCIGLDKQSKKYWQCYCSKMVTTAHYYGGTCAMGSVVDSNLFVKGIKRLRIADASIIPNVIGAPTGAAVVVIAQKAADMILKSV